MPGRASKNKGHAYENYIAKRLRELGWVDAHRHLEFQPSEAEASMDLVETQPLAIQCKCWKSAPPITTLETVKPNVQYPIPVAILKRTRSKGKKTLEVAVLPLEVFFDMLAILIEHGALDIMWDTYASRFEEDDDAEIG